MSKYLFCLVGESGSGKTTLANKMEEYGLTQIYSYTTRPRRSEFETGHTFVNQEEFDKIRYQLRSYTKFNNYEYGVTGQQIDEHDIFVVDYDGLKYMRSHYKGNKAIQSIYISAPNRRGRMLLRGDNPKKVEERINYDKEAFKDVYMQTDYAIYNDDLDKATQILYDYITAIKDGDF